MIMNLQNKLKDIFYVDDLPKFFFKKILYSVE
jgi:hypothetical protein